MNPHPPHFKTASGRRRLDSIALVVTLLMLSVITFLTVAFLAMTRRNQADVSGTQDLAMARAMGDAAASRAQGEILAQMLAHGDALYYDYMVSRAFINPNGFTASHTYDPNNVNYDKFTTGNTNFSAAYWAQNIANLSCDPRPPVFVATNPNPAYPLDFRFYVDINRNGRFETNGYQPTVGNNGLLTGTNAVLNGEPEFIGVLRNPLYPHSATNPFVGRYAYLVLPIGKECDINYIGNDAKANYMNTVSLTNASNPGHIYGTADGFARDQGVGSWELNLAGLLDALSPWAYEDPTAVTYRDPVFGRYLSGFIPYSYWVPTSLHPNTGNAFGDAEAILHYRDWSYTLPYLQSLRYNFTNYAALGNNGIDYYCVGGALNYPFDYSNFPAQNQYVSRPWPGSYSSNNFFDPQDLFDPAKTSVLFTNRMLLAGSRTNSFDRYTFQRLISCLGMGSSPEYGVWVNDNNGNPTLRTKVNINYDNTAQITNVNAPYAPMPINLTNWTPLGFFTNAAELLLRSQGYVYANYSNYNGTWLFTGLGTNYFGVTNIPIYRTNNPGIRYDAAVHRMLQLAANIYDAANSNTYTSSSVPGQPLPPPVRHPSVFRPLFQIVNPGTANAGLNISGYALVTSASDAWKQMQLPFQDFSNVLNGTFNTNWNVAGIPWVVAANKGLPEFYHYTCESQVLFTRKLDFPRYLGAGGLPETSAPPHFTNQFYLFGITNSIGLDAWNSYSNAFAGASGNYYYFSNYVTIALTNGYNGGIVFPPLVITSSNVGNPFFYGPFHWNPAARNPSPNNTSGFVTLYKNTNIATLPAAYYSESYRRFYYLTNPITASNSFLPTDMAQTGWPVYNWTLLVTNHLVYALFDGPPGTTNGALLDFVNFGPFGSSLSLTQLIASVSTTSGLGAAGSTNTTGNYWAIGNATSLPNSPISQGVLNQIAAGESDPTFANNIIGSTNYPHDSYAVFDCPCRPTWVVQQMTNWVANDPLVHYTLDDLTWMGDPAANPPPQDISPPVISATPTPVLVPVLSNTVGMVSIRYAPWGRGNGTVAAVASSMLFKDPLLTNSSAWQFPTNKFPGVGWIGRVHRGTPWQTVYLKADSSSPGSSYLLWSNWANPTWLNYPNMPETYPTRDWPLVDVFTTAPNDNAARGLLSVNQTNDAAWAAVFAGVIVPTNANGAAQIMPNANNGVLYDFTSLMDGPYGINAQRANYPNGIFHKVGNILGASALTTNSPFLVANGGTAAEYSDEVVERIPQQVLSLLKVGEPQFAIFAWGQSLRPKGPPYLVSGPNMGIYTNYQITGEYLSRTICHLVHTNGLKMVIDSYNVEPGN
jgi:hypothetical protein